MPTHPHSRSRRTWLRQTLGAATGGALLATGVAPMAHAGSRMTPKAPPPFRLPVEGHPGEFQTLEALVGKVVLLNFWATWCVPCRREFPALNAIAAEFGPQGLVVLGVNIEDDDANADVTAFLRKARPTFTVVRDRDMAVARACSIPGMPATFLIDRQGRMRWQHGGYQPGEESRYIAQARLLLAEPA